ncbi:MAG TPA: hypothetical protein PLD47_01775 [Aggregatilineales bacterium]|nr:hypothetical protein [Aggregatilineales bacterium]
MTMIPHFESKWRIEEHARSLNLPLTVLRPVAFRPPDPEMLIILRWFKEKGYEADIAAVRALYPPLMSLETWLRLNEWKNAQPVPETEHPAWG